MPQVAFGGGATETVLGPNTAAILALVLVLILVLPRKYVLIPALLGVFLIPQGNVFVLGGVHLQPARIISFVGLSRLVILRFVSNEKVLGTPWNSIDTVFVFWALSRSTASILLWMSKPALVNEAGHLWTSLGMYFLLRSLLRNDRDVRTLIKVFAVIAVLNGTGMLYEHFKVHNLFSSYLGGVQSAPSIRNGTVRSQGAFQHAILAGTFGTTLLPLLAWLWRSGKNSVFVLLGFVGAVAMVATSGSSTPIMACTGSLIALCFWPLRSRMRLVRWILVLALITLHLVMNAPVWFLIAHVDVTGSSTGYFRAFLIDQSVKHFSDWWLVGTNSNANWGEDMWDLSNQFVAEGFSGGVLTLILFIAIISKCFGRIGLARKRVQSDRKDEWLLWLLGVTLFGHIMVYFGVSYWDQMWCTWAALLAVISAVTASRLTISPRQQALEPTGAHVTLFAECSSPAAF
jgi:hypothetical protein